MRWPEGKKCAVVISVDFDAETFFLDGVREADYPFMANLSRGQYGARVGLPRMLDLLDRYSIRGTFFVPGYVAEKYPGKVEAILARGHDLGHHGYLHASPVEQSADEEREAIEKGLKALEKIAGTRPMGYRAPSWEPTRTTFELLEEYKFVYESSLMADEVPYRLVLDGRPTSLVELPIDWLLDDAAHYYFNFSPKYRVGLADSEKVARMWIDEFEGYYASGGCFILVLHPQVSGRPHRIKALERVIEHMQRKGDVWFARGIEVAEWFAKSELE